jgi:hypothetical protein
MRGWHRAGPDQGWLPPSPVGSGRNPLGSLPPRCTSVSPSSLWLRPFAFPSAGRQRLSSYGLQLPLLLDALQAALQKINLQGLLANLTLQLRYTAFLPPLLAHTRKGIAWTATKFAPPAVQHVGIDFKGPRYFGDRAPASSRCSAANLNSRVNCRRDKPMTQSSIRWDFHPIR